MATPKDKRASIAVAMIAFNAEKTLETCLRSFAPFVRQIIVCVDDRTTDKTARIAKKCGAEVHLFEMCEEHVCPDHGRIKAQHFGKARQHSFTFIKPDLDYIYWIDSDDVLEGAEFLPQVCAAVDRTDACGVWLQYLYAWSAENGQRQPNTVFHRERLLRTHVSGQQVAWEWRGRVHETVAPIGLEQPRWVFPEQAMPWASALKVVHQDGAHKSENSAARNLRLLEIDYEEAPGDARTTFYLGNQYFALNRMADAAEWYSRVLQDDENPYQRWQAAIYLHKALMRLGNVDAAEAAAWEAIRAVDQHAEPYFALAETALVRGRFDDVLKWTEKGRVNAQPLPPWVFLNPLDTTFNSRIPYATALEQLGRITSARHEYEAAYRIMPAGPIGEAIHRLRRTETSMRQAQAAADLLADRSDDEALRLWRELDLPADVRAFGRCRDVVIPAMIRERDQKYVA